jgi:hypothetical protein
VVTQEKAASRSTEVLNIGEITGSVSRKVTVEHSQQMAHRTAAALTYIPSFIVPFLLEFDDLQIL